MSHTNPFSLAGKRALVAGASRGIGKGVARELAAAGMRLVITARRADRLEELATELEDAFPIAGDVTDAKLAQHLIDAAVAKIDHIHFYENRKVITGALFNFCCNFWSSWDCIIDLHPSNSC